MKTINYKTLKIKFEMLEKFLSKEELSDPEVSTRLLRIRQKLAHYSK